MAIEHKECTSSNLASHGYDPDTKTLEVKFKNGSHYAYRDVSQETYDAFTGAESLGSHLAKNIKGKFEFAKLG